MQTEEWTLDPLGNIDVYKFDGDGDELFDSAADLDDDRTHNDANETTAWDPFPADPGQTAVNPILDRNGSLTDDKFTKKYEYDAWNRLTLAEAQNGDDIGIYVYDGLGRRVEHIYDTDGDGIAETNGDDEVQHEYYTGNWERIEVRPDDSTVGVSMFLYGIRGIDDIVLRFRDANETGPVEEQTYYLTDANGNVVMTVNADAEGQERITYNAYGKPEVFPFGDLDGDYDVDGDDLTVFDLIKDTATTPQYNLAGDVNMDGVLDGTDRTLISNYSGRLGGDGVLSIDDVANDIGYAAYLFNDETGNSHVRNREYSYEFGRFLQRDPLEYPDGFNLYQYITGDPISGRDPYGLSAVPAPRFLPVLPLPPLPDFAPAIRACASACAAALYGARVWVHHVLTGSGNHEAHGNDRTEGIDRQIEEAEEKLKNAITRKNKVDLKNLIKNLKAKRAEQRKGPTHWRNPGQSRPNNPRLIPFFWFWWEEDERGNFA